MYLNAGDFDQRITVQQPSTSVDVLGQRVETWSDVLTGIAAKWVPKGGREFFAAGSEQSVSEGFFLVRYRTTITARMRVVWRGVKYAIVAEPQDVDGKRETLQIVVAAGVRDGR